jgi:hypothetical protein
MCNFYKMTQNLQIIGMKYEFSLQNKAILVILMFLRMHFFPNRNQHLLKLLTNLWGCSPWICHYVKSLTGNCDRELCRGLPQQSLSVSVSISLHLLKEHQSGSVPGFRWSLFSSFSWHLVHNKLHQAWMPSTHIQEIPQLIRWHSCYPFLTKINSKNKIFSLKPKHFINGLESNVLYRLFHSYGQFVKVELKHGFISC